MENALHIPVTLTEKRTIVPNVYEYTFTVQSKKWSFLPGQYVWLIFDKQVAQYLQRDREAFSLSSSNSTSGKFSILFSTTPSPYKNALQHLSIGDQMLMRGPCGSSYIIPKNSTSKIVFIVGGTGISPLLSHLRSKNTEHIAQVIVLHSREKPSILQEEIQSLCINTHTPCLQMRQHFKKESIAKLLPINTLFYICGSQEMVNAVHNELLRGGYVREQMRFEQFYPQTLGAMHA